MANREYRLLDKSGDIDLEDQKAMEDAKCFFNKYKGTDVEAFHFGDLIILPKGAPGIDASSKISIQKVNRIKIDYISHLNNKELEEALVDLKKGHNLNQGQLKNITMEINRLRRDLKKGEENIEQLKKLMKEVTIQKVDEKQIKDYLAKIKRYCKQLEDNLFLDNPELLNKEIKGEVLNRLDVLESFIEDFRKQYV
ncbi:hypothetical protein [Virgibacillus ihumii]|uniref:hypothetical protein n=1 Tax=Virgibacillus ihumii TaxID=2686091 RepID=UPI00157D3311|nr:hypothetical protein [Virgibacillus ihumii]